MRHSAFPPLREAHHIYLSPHLDDAVLSCGGMITQQRAAGQRVAVVTIFAGDPPEDAMLSDFARGLHERWQAADPTAARRAEDRCALRALHPEIEIFHLPLPECLYRRNPASGAWLYASEEALFGAVHPSDPALMALQTPPTIPPGASLYAPLGVGNHVDHQVVRRAAETWGMALCYYEEFPYTVGNYPGAAAPAPTGWRRTAALPGADALAAKVRAVACYTSQLSTFWESLEEMAHAVRTYEERVWYPPPADG
jgi:LmbE family N-acetylglucosaminyl deacetylase